MPTSDPVIIARNNLARAHMRRLPPDERARAVADAQRTLSVVVLERTIKERLAETPPLLPEQCDRLAALIYGGQQ